MSHESPIIQEDFSALLELIEHDTMRDVVGMLVAAVPQRLEAMRQGLASDDLSVTATACHTLRSGCGQLGARTLEALCAACEQAAKRGEREPLAALVGEIEAESRRVVEWFAQQGWIAPHPGEN